MKYLICLLGLIFTPNIVPAQDLNTLIKDFEQKSEFKHATVAFSLLNEQGEMLIGKNADKSLPAASTQKVITSISALEILGHNHKFVTTLSIEGGIVGSELVGNIIIKSGGDPVLGSEDFKGHYGEFLTSWVQAVKDKGITNVRGRLIIDDRIFKGARNAGSTVLDDVGNYYGAGAPSFSFMDNEFTVFFNTAGKNTLATVESIKPKLPQEINVINEVRAGNVSGDNVIIYSLDEGTEVFLTGLLPPNKKNFKVRGSIPNVTEFAENYITGIFSKQGVEFKNEQIKGPLFTNSEELIRTKSPTLIEILKVLNRKSVNTYADVIFKHLGLKTEGKGDFNSAEKAVLNLWRSKGIDVSGINLEDGSGLSRKNMLTPSFYTSVLSYVDENEQVKKFFTEASKSSSVKSMWGGNTTQKILAKSGYIGNVRSYGGFLLKNGEKYPFHIIIHNYSSSSSAVRKNIGIFLNQVYDKI